MDTRIPEEASTATDHAATDTSANAQVASDNNATQRDLALRFIKLFPGYDQAYGIFTNLRYKPTGKVDGDAWTKRGRLSLQIVIDHLSGGNGLGVVPLRGDDTCCFGVIDIDIQGKVKLSETFQDLEQRVRALGLPLVLCSSKSRGAHLYLFMSEPVPAWLIKKKLEQWSVALDYGGCEVFPKQVSRGKADDLGNWINLPYYEGFGVTLREAYVNGCAIRLPEFLDYADSKKISADELERFEPKQPAEGEEDPTPSDAEIGQNRKSFDGRNSYRTSRGELFADGPPCLQRLAAEGFGQGLRNDALFNIALYFRKRNPDSWQDDVVKFNIDHMDPTLPNSEVQNVIKSVDKKDYGYGCDKPPLCNVCDRQLCLKREFGIGGGGLLGIIIGNRQLPDITEEAWEWVQKRNAENPSLFRFGDQLSRIELDDRQCPTMRFMTPDILIHELGRAVNWYKKGGKKPQATHPPKPVANDMLATPRDKVPLPPLRGITTAPIIAADGDVRMLTGYDAKTRLFFGSVGKLDMPSVPEAPTKEQVQQACALVLDDMLGDFPFEGDSDRAHTLALFLLPFARELIDGSTPLHLIGKPKAGTGASLMVEALAMPFLGRAPDMKAPPIRNEEWGKVITACLREAPPFMVIDNLREEVDSAALASALTSDTITDRLLGTSELVRLPVRCVWVATGNNPTLSAEITRRCVRIQINAKVERPQDRSEFRHADLRGWVREHRGPLIAAALTILRAWIVAGRPRYDGPLLGSYEPWSRVMGGILQHAEVGGFLQDRDRLYEGTDRETETARLLIHSWINHPYLNQRKVSTQQLLDLVMANAVPVQVGGFNDHNANVRLGKYLGGLIDQRFTFQTEHGPLTVEFKKDRPSGGSARWRLDTIEGQLPSSEKLRSVDDDPPF